MSLVDHTAPGINAAFSYQFERALYWLARSQAGFVIGIETQDDVCVRSPHGGLVLEQDKHSIDEDATPFGDRSRDLWNTLAIWIEALDSKEVLSETTRFLIVTNKELMPCIAKQIGSAESPLQITECVTALEAAANDPPRHIANLMQRVLRTESRSNLRTLISNTDLMDAAQASAGQDLRNQIIAHLPLPAYFRNHADSIIDELLGWLHSTTLTTWQKGERGWIQRDNFMNQLFAIIDRRKKQLTRERAEHLIPVSDDKIGQERGSCFVKQLHLVTEDESIVDTAIREFIRCNIEKSRLSAEGNITDEDWKSFEGMLTSRWQKIRARVMRMKAGLLENDIGYEIFTETSEGYREKLAGIDTEQVYLTSGTYHRLADMIAIGWHPRFQELMEGRLRAS